MGATPTLCAQKAPSSQALGALVGYYNEKLGGAEKQLLGQKQGSLAYLNQASIVV